MQSESEGGVEWKSKRNPLEPLSFPKLSIQFELTLSVCAKCQVQGDKTALAMTVVVSTWCYVNRNALVLVASLYIPPLFTQNCCKQLVKLLDV